MGDTGQCLDMPNFNAREAEVWYKTTELQAYFNGAGQSALNLMPSRACTMANSLVMARTAPLLAVYAS